jgi:hypothetical protein
LWAAGMMLLLLLLLLLLLHCLMAQLALQPEAPM